MTGHELKRLRESLPLTQKELGEIIGVTRQWVGRYEKEADEPLPDHWCRYIKERLKDHGLWREK